MIRKSIIKTSIVKISALLVIVSLNWTGLLAVGETISYFTDTEGNVENVLSVSTLDFSVNSLSAFTPGSLAEGEHSYRAINVSNEGDLNFQYRIFAKSLTGDLCDYVRLEANLDGGAVECASTGLSGFACSPFTFSDPDQWSFNATLSSSTPTTMRGKSCSFKIVFEAWQEGVSYGAGGFTDIEEIDSAVSMKNPTGGVVLNEFLPNPEGNQYGYDFGADNSDMPRGEWVELYNNSGSPVNLSGWYIRDNLDSSDHKILIDTAHTGLTTQTIGANGFLVVFMNKALFNNDSDDSVRLFNAEDVLIDSYSYTIPADFCNLEPTEGSTNDENGNGVGKGCINSVPSNKSYARIPDGVGGWVDPIPTPGQSNILEEEKTSVVEPLATKGVAAEEPVVLVVIEETSAEEDAVVEENAPAEENDIIEEEAAVEEAPAVEEAQKEDTTVQEVQLPTEEPVVTEETPVVEEDVVVEEPAQTQDVIESPEEPETVEVLTTNTETVALPLEDSQSVVELIAPPEPTAPVAE